MTDESEVRGRGRSLDSSGCSSTAQPRSSRSARKPLSLSINYIDFQYPPLVVTITGAAPISISPESGLTPGETVTVSASRNICTSPYSAFVQLFPKARMARAAAVAGGTSIPPTQGAWISTMTIPADLMPGHYEVEADCIYSRGAYQGSYQPVDVSINS